MPGFEKAELYFIAAMMFLILILCTVAVYIFVRTYKKEMREKELRKKTPPKSPAQVGEKESLEPEA